MTCIKGNQERVCTLFEVWRGKYCVRQALHCVCVGGGEARGGGGGMAFRPTGAASAQPCCKACCAHTACCVRPCGQATAADATSTAGATEVTTEEGGVDVPMGEADGAGRPMWG